LPVSRPKDNIPDLYLEQTSLVVLVNVDVDGEMCVDESHLVLESFCDTDDQVVDESADSSESSNILSRTMVQFDVDYILLGLGEVDGQMVEVLCELAYSSVNTVSVSLPFDGSIPRGPSTVINLDLIWTLTI
jgi:hypothetical protein